MYIIPLFYAMAYIFTQVVIQHDSEEVISQAQTASYLFYCLCADDCQRNSEARRKVMKAATQANRMV